MPLGGRAGRDPRLAGFGFAVLTMLVAAICWYFGTDAWHAILFGGVLATLGLLCLARPQFHPTHWSDPVGRDRAGARTEVAELSWSLRSSWGRINDRPAWRVRELAHRRLAMHQLDLRDPSDRDAIEQLIGSRTYTFLVRRGRRPPTLRELIRCLDALDALDPNPTS